MNGRFAISAVVPCYNSEMYLPRLFQCFRQQTFGDFELILIDDCSTDSTLSSLVAFAKEREMEGRVKVIKTSKNHGGPSEVRNIGLRAANGKYLSFIDHDDCFEPEFFNRLYTLAEENKADFVSCGIQKVLPDGRAFIFSSHDYSMPGGLTALYAATEFLFNLSTWGHIFSREVVMERGLRYFDGANEDAFFNIKLLYYCRHYVATKEILYYYMQNGSSLTHREDSEAYSYVEGFVTGLDRINDFLREIRRREPLPPKVERAVQLFWLRYSLSQLAKAEASTPKEKFEEVLWQSIRDEFGSKAAYIRSFLDIIAQYKEDQGKPVEALPFSHKIM